MKRSLFPALLAALFLCPALLLPARAASPFTDVTEADRCWPAVEWALRQQVTDGTSPATFSPDRICTRGQVVTFLWRALGRPAPADPRNPFSDVAPGSYCEDAVLWAVEQGVTDGTSASTFSPELDCAQAHILTFLWRAVGSPQGSPAGTLAGLWPQGYYTEALRWAEDMGLPEAGFQLNAPCSRAETVVYLYSVCMAAAAPDGGWDPAVIQRQVILDEGAMCGAVLVGSFADRDRDGLILDRAVWDRYLQDSGLTEDYDFLRELPDENIVQVPGGRQLILLIPLDPQASVAVNRWDVSEASGWRGETGQVLYRSDAGAPVLLLCAWHDEIPDAQVVIVDSQGNTLDWKPGLSMESGRLDTGSASGGKVCDLTRYS